MKILVVEDEASVSSFIKKGLQEQGYEVTQAFDGVSGFKLASQTEQDIIIVDVVMPGMNGIDLCGKIRNELGLKVPILMLTALGTTDDVVLGLESGADDYLTKPFKFQELLARIRALSRRSNGSESTAAKLLEADDLTLNLRTKEVHRGGKEIELTAREFKFLEYLLKNKNIVVSRVDILENVWEVGFDLGTNVIDVYVNYLRKKIDAGFEDKLIKTVIGMGYVIKDRT
ncbi:MAG: two-component system copper resistance phosphate regulon response regulator CusR [Parvicellaceae bacterium]|jgi:two-component system copper resistance phosphate regulon response regulator CusR